MSEALQNLLILSQRPLNPSQTRSWCLDHRGRLPNICLLQIPKHPQMMAMLVMTGLNCLMAVYGMGKISFSYSMMEERPFRKVWDVTLLIQEVERITQENVVEIPTVTTGANNYVSYCPYDEAQPVGMMLCYVVQRFIMGLDPERVATDFCSMLSTSCSTLQDHTTTDWETLRAFTCDFRMIATSLHDARMPT